MVRWLRRCVGLRSDVSEVRFLPGPRRADVLETGDIGGDKFSGLTRYVEEPRRDPDVTASSPLSFGAEKCGKGLEKQGRLRGFGLRAELFSTEVGNPTSPHTEVGNPTSLHTKKSGPGAGLAILRW